MAKESFTAPMKVTLTSKLSVPIDVTDSHIFVGYKPLVIGIVGDSALSSLMEVCLSFHHAPFEVNSLWKGFDTDRNSVARMTLQKIFEHKFENGTCVFFEGDYGEHVFISKFHQVINDVRLRMTKQPAGNVDLPGNLHDMVRIAYSVPRTISLITLQENGKMNMFPTDLHGAISEKIYVSSLRKNGKANEQVERIGKLSISTVDATSWKDTYGLGKNHMRELSSADQFPCGERTTSNFGIPLPRWATGYRELSLKKSLDAGIHRIHFYEVENSVKLNNEETLAHIHQYYAQWRLDRGLKTELLL